jgi:predicted nucleotidyltransferase
MVVLFGSHARGDWVEDPAGGYFSDFDVLFVVKSRRMVDEHKLWSRVEQRAQRLTQPTELSVIVHDIAGVNEQIERGSYFFGDLKKEGGKRAGDLHPLLRNVFPRGTAEEDRLFKLLKNAYVDARYDPGFSITKEELEGLAARVRELRDRVERVCRERIDAMRGFAAGR